MEYELEGLIVLAFLLWTSWIVRGHRRRKEAVRLPPGPTPWPLVGNSFQLGLGPPHESFVKLAQKHGPVMTLWLGSMNTVVISSDEAARVMFKNHDVVLAGRKIYEAMKGDYGNEGSLITAQYGQHWRMLRRLCTTEFFTTSRLDGMRVVRQRCVDQMVEFIHESGGSGSKEIDIGRFFFLMAFNLMGNLIFSKDLLDPRSERGSEFFFHAGKVMEFAGKANVADFFPMLRWLDPQGLRRKTQFHVNHAFDIVGEFLQERLGAIENDRIGEKIRDYLDVLLEYRGDGVEGPSIFGHRTINVIIFEMFTAGTDTTTSTLEWAMAELLHNLTALRKVQTELRTLTNGGEKLEEENLNKLPYLNAVIKETLRLHPPLPFLVPHMAMDDCKMFGYLIPKQTQILVNVWAIGRDPKTWKDPSEFRPERFLDPNMVDYKGQHFEFIPFGSGRRMCPAVPLVARVLPLALGSVLHSFDWVLADGMKAEELDMSERMGITLRKGIPLKAIPVPYKASKFFDAMKGVMECGGDPNISDLFSWLRWLDPQGLRRKMDRDMGKAIDIASKFVKERIDERKKGGPKMKDFLDVLLDFEGSKNEPAAKLSELQITIFILEIFFAGSETSSTSIEWAMAELLHNPEKIIKVKTEISSVIESNRTFEESDIDKLPYLQAVIKETLRLHPPIPFLIPRKAIQDTNFMGYLVPKNTQVFVNVWAIGRDEEIWEELMEFRPERFLGSNIDYRGQHFKFIPNGAGRRICPGLPLGQRMMHFVLGSLLHEFNWELDFATNPDDNINMADKIGTVVRKLDH